MMGSPLCTAARTQDTSVRLFSEGGYPLVVEKRYSERESNSEVCREGARQEVRR